MSVSSNVRTSHRARISFVSTLLALREVLADFYAGIHDLFLLLGKRKRKSENARRPDVCILFKLICLANRLTP